MQIELPSRLGTMVQEKVESGEYLDAAEVVAAALQLLEERDEAAKLERLRAAIKLGRDQLDRGEGILWTPELHDQLLENARRRALAGDLPHPDVVP